MALEFRSSAPVGEAELFIELDFEGLLSLMKAFEAALAGGRSQLTSEASGGSGITGAASPNAFARVTFTFANPASGASAGPA